MTATLRLIFLFLLANAFLVQVFSLSVSLWNPLLVIVVREAFFGGFDLRRYLSVAFLCGFLADAMGADVFGLHIVSFPVAAVVVAQAARTFSRQEWRLYPAAVFLAVFLNHHLIAVIKTVFVVRGSSFHYGIFLGKALLEAAGSVAAAYLLQRRQGVCAPDSTD